MIAGTRVKISNEGDIHVDNSLTINVLLDALVGQDGTTVNIDFVGNGNIITEHRNVLQASPAAHRAVPSNNGRLDPRVVLDLAVLHQDAALQTHAVTNHHIGSNHNIRTDAAVLANLSGGVDHNIAAIHIRLAVGGEQLRVALGKRGEVEAGTAQEILGLTNVHPEALQVEGVQLAVLDDSGEGLLLDGGGAQLDTVQHAGVQDVDTGVDTVADELNRLLDEAVDARGVVGLVDNDTVLGGLVDLGDHNGTLVAVVLVELGQLLEGIVTDNIGVQDEKRAVVLAQNLLRQLQGTSRAEGFGFHREFDSDIVDFFVLGAAVSIGGRQSEQVGQLYLLQGRHHNIGAVVDGQDDICDTRSSQALNLVQDHGPVGEFDQRLRESQGLSSIENG